MQQKGKQFLLHYWHLLCYCCQKSGGKTRMRKGLDYNKGSISMVICDKDTKSWLLVTKIPSHGYLWQRYQVMVTCDKDTKSWLQLQNFQSDDFNLTTRNSLSFFKFTCNIVLIYLKTMCSLTECKCLFLPIIYWDSKTALSDYCWPWKVGFFKKFNLVNEHFIQRLVWFDLIFGV